MEESKGPYEISDDPANLSKTTKTQTWLLAPRRDSSNKMLWKSY